MTGPRTALERVKADFADTPDGGVAAVYADDLEMLIALVDASIARRANTSSRDAIAAWVAAVDALTTTQEDRSDG